MRDYNKIPFRSPRSGHSNNNTGNRASKGGMMDNSGEVLEEKKTAAEPSKSSTATTSTVTTLTASDGHHHHPSRTRSPSPQPPRQHLATGDALAVRRDGAEQTIQRLRGALEESSAKDAVSQSTLAKSDAIILELRSSVRQLKRQTEQLQQEKHAAEMEKEAAQDELHKLQHNTSTMNNTFSSNRSLAEMSAEARDARVGELQIQLDRAHAQILTADMIRKELEDTLEAEQYTWELRVQDQDRTIEQLQQECTTLADELERARDLLKGSEDASIKEIQELQVKLSVVQQEAQHWKSMQSDTNEAGALKERILTMEQERAELQSCLDEALKELEAVDAELQGDNTASLREENKRLRELVGKQGDARSLEPLENLHRWLLERDGVQVESKPRSSLELVSAIQTHVEQTPQGEKNVAAANHRVRELEAQLSVFRGDLKAREESSAELRSSLKEAVSLLKPLQDAVSKADLEKARMQETINRLRESGADSEKHVEIRVLRQTIRDKDDEIEALRETIESLELQLSRAKLETANGVMNAQRSFASQQSPDSLSKAREELRAKRAAESNLKQLLRDAQSRFRNNSFDQADSRSIASSEVVNTLQHTIEVRDARLHELESETKVLRGELAKKDVEIRAIRKQSLEDGVEDTSHQESTVLKKQLSQTAEQLKMKKESEKALNKSLKEALGLLKPLQAHLEEAENEKRSMAKEMRHLRQKLGEVSSAKSIPGNDASDNGQQRTVRDLEMLVRQLEMENSQLHDTIEDLSQSINISQLSGMSNNKAESKAHEQLVEMKSLYEVTKGRLDDAYLENQTLLEGLKKRDNEEKAMVDELHILREQLKSTESELENAKFIATSALVKVEELTMANVEQLSLNSSVEQQDAMFNDTSREFEQMAAARQNRNKAAYRLT